MSGDQLNSDERKKKSGWWKAKQRHLQGKGHRLHFCLLELNLGEISALFFPPPFFLLPHFDVKLNGSAAHSWMWPTHKTLKTHVESLLPISSCVTLADYIYVAIFRQRWLWPAYYTTKHTLIFAQLIFDVHGLRRHFPNKFAIVSSFMLHLWNIFWNYFRQKEVWKSICSSVTFKGNLIHLGCLQQYTVHCIV